VLSDQRVTETYGDFVAEHERALRQALTSCFGSDAGRDAAADALAYGWEHWGRVSEMDNPVGYLFTVGRDRGRRAGARWGSLRLRRWVSLGWSPDSRGRWRRYPKDSGRL